MRNALPIALALLVAFSAFAGDNVISNCYAPVKLFDEPGDTYFLKDAGVMVSIPGSFETETRITDGTLEGTRTVPNPDDTEMYSVSQLVIFNPDALLPATDSLVFGVSIIQETKGQDLPIRLWVLDLESATWRHLIDYPDLNSNQGMWFVGTRNRAYFTLNGFELWTTDGTAEGTVLLRDFTSDVNALEPSPFYQQIEKIFQSLGQIGDDLIFAAPSADTGVELWRSNGTPEGTTLIRNLLSELPDTDADETSSRPRGGYTSGEYVYFRASYSGEGATTGAAVGVFRTDGTTEGTVLLPDVPHPEVAVLNDKLYFASLDGLSRTDWDGTNPETVIASPPYVTSYSAFSGVATFGDQIVYLFPADPNELWYSYATNLLWLSDGESAGTPIVETYGFYEGGPLYPLFALSAGRYRYLMRDDTLYTFANLSNYRPQLWRVNGENGDTKRMADLSPASSWFDDDHLNGVWEDKYFVGDYLVVRAESRNESYDALWSINLDPGPPESAHTADINQDYILDLTELLRLIQFFNSDGFHVQFGTEDGYAPGPGDTTGAPHDSDYAEQDWQINLSELLRATQLYNAPVCNYCTAEGTEDGFAV